MLTRYRSLVLLLLLTILRPVPVVRASRSGGSIALPVVRAAAERLRASVVVFSASMSRATVSLALLSRKVLWATMLLTTKLWVFSISISHIGSLVPIG